VQIVLKTAPDSFSIRVSDQGNGSCPYPDTQTSGDGTRMVAAFARQIDAAVTKRRNPAGYAVTVSSSSRGSGPRSNIGWNRQRPDTLVSRALRETGNDK
jgi:two-component sensor histidine kinase